MSTQSSLEPLVVQAWIERVERTTVSDNTKMLLLEAAQASLIVAIAAGVIFSATGRTELEALLFGGGTFGGCMLICIGVIALD